MSQDQTPCDEVLRTIFCEIEHTVNSRPLTHVSVDCRDPEALTPNHFLIGTSSFADAFWRRWLREYLPSLIAREKWHERNEPLKKGDIVLITDLQAPRNLWKKSKIVNVFRGADGEIRVAKVSASTGELVHPIHKLIHLFSLEDVQK